MTRRLKSLGLVLVGAIALGVGAAPAAQAGEFTAEEFPATITGMAKANHQFKFNMGSVTCKTASFHGNLAAASNMLTLSAAYGECTTGAGGAVNVRMTSCDYRLHANETLEEDEVAGSLDIVCAEAGDGIDFEVPASGCVVKVQPQNGLNSVIYTDHTIEKDFDLDLAINGLAYKQNANCGAGEGAFGNGEYTGTSTMTGEKEGAVDGVIVR